MGLSGKHAMDPPGPDPAVWRFRWHPEARLIGADGMVAMAPAAVARGPVIDDRPGVPALQAALAAGCFRIGATGAAAPEPLGQPSFETLSGGTSGAARRIRRTQASWVASFAVNAALFGIGPGVRVAVPGRLVHSLALYGALEGVHLGAEVYLLDGVRPDRQAQALARAAIDVIYATPAQLRLLLEAGIGWPDLRLVLAGGSKLDGATRATLRAAAPMAEVREFYGAAEASFITLADAATPDGAVGRPYPGVDVRLDPSGEIWVRSPYLFAGYAGEDGGAVWRDGWLSVGEYGALQDGYLIVHGRGNRMVTVADQNVFPEEIEAFLLAQPGVAQAAVLPRPDGLRGHVIEAVLQGDPAVEAAVLAAARAAFGPLKAPRRLYWRADWPVLPSGKTDLAALRAAIG